MRACVRVCCGLPACPLLSGMLVCVLFASVCALAHHQAYRIKLIQTLCGSTSINTDHTSSHLFNRHSLTLTTHKNNLLNMIFLKKRAYESINAPHAVS